ERGVIDSGCSRNMTGNMSYLTDFEEIDGGYVAFGGNPKGEKITGRGGLTYLFAKATSDESKLWHRRLGHINFRIMNKLVKGNLVRGLPLKLFKDNQTCVACQKGKQHRASLAERKNRTLIEAARTMLADSKLPTTFWAEAALGFMRPFRCPVTILNTIDHLDKFDGKADEGFFVGYSINSKAIRVFNNRTRIVEENMHVHFSKNTPNIAGSGPNWLFDIDALTKSMNYKPIVAGNQSNGNAGTKACDDAGDDEKKVTEEPRKEGGDSSKDSECSDQQKENNVNSTNTINAASTNEVNVVGAKTSIELPDDPNMSELEDIIYSDDDEDVGAEADINNLDAFMSVSPIPTTRVHKDHPVKQIIRDLNSTPQTSRMTKNLEEPEEPKKVIHALKDPRWIEAMQEELLQFKLQEVWTLVDLPNGKRAIGFKDPDFPDRVYKVEKALYGLHHAPRAWDKGDILLVQVYVDDIIFGSTKKSLCTEFEKMMHKKFQMSSMDELTFFLGPQVKQKKDGIFISQDKYVIEILKKFDFTDVKTASTPMETQKLLLKDEDGEEVNVQLYRSTIGSLMYLTSSRPDIMFAVCQPKLGLWYPKDSLFDLVAYTDSDYAGASLDRKSTTGGCQFLGSRLISWQCKKQIVVANSTTKAEYMAASSCCRQVLWIQNQLLDYGYNNGKLMLLGINLLLLGKVNAARDKLTTAGES
ncbi:putative ribonuclease H-like domain-containing protein, partial [Tanacetum coccineum]